ncbi:MAG TPA: sigma-70 family RNA polymerase sigma factor [Bacillota bacterium]|nr:sigma-70 family RNA polymerase sigma factor [Bacillota bacterium]
MHGKEQTESPGAQPHTLFVTTRWSVVLAAKDKASPDSAAALEILCRTYWYPLYAFVRGSGFSPEDAQDLTQEFFVRLLAKDYLRVVEPEKGRFRTFLRMALKRFLANEWERLRAQKRGSGQAPLAFDTTLAEQRFYLEPANSLSPDRIYDRRWALTLLEQAVLRLESEYIAADKPTEWQHLKAHLTAERGAIPYTALAADLQTTEGAARVAVHRLRKRFREIFRTTLADTVSAPEEIEGELAYVLEVLAHA